MSAEFEEIVAMFIRVFIVWKYLLHLSKDIALEFYRIGNPKNYHKWGLIMGALGPIIKNNPIPKV